MSTIEILNSCDVVIVGTGFTGATYAQQLMESGYKVGMIDKREHIAGNAYTDRRDSIDIHVYGAHIFHTPNEEVWDYVNNFAEFNEYKHRVLAISDDQVLSLPFTLKTLSEIYGYRMSPLEGKKLLEIETRKYVDKPIRNLEEKALSLVGPRVYERLIKYYTEKQWGTRATELDSSIITRLPFRLNYDTRYFNDKYEGIPVNGYTNLISNMIRGAHVRLGVDWFDIRDKIDGPYVIYTGPVDKFFDYKSGRLGWRSVRFEDQYLEGVEDFQGIPVMNYCDPDVDYTRIVEHKHFNKLPGHVNGTWISYERSCSPTATIDPYYPINQSEDRLAMAGYRDLKEKVKTWAHICGRLGDYKYLDMHQAIGIVLKEIDEVGHRIQERLNNR
ncbi:putative UDP-galactopyranose mutase [Sinorhizobium phage phiM9]|uniref:Putative UDP-galactopyranose mutase n=1 Tax=Sinorhizobium phage phiM9 TaxID=1636182 RepID=A0A0F6TGN8_9CAUD|nr:putative UDP-galactopyranose mutase [Sinorhizobium phage phiM9]AKE44774.1 putative UDP-galactopyranose mutase [Sinorhizobium phage phiM9]